MRAPINSTVTFTCSAGSASPLTLINFYFNNTLYFDPNNFGQFFDVGIFVNSTFNQSDCSIRSTLTIEQFNEQFVGQYSCSVSIFTTDLEGSNETFSLEVATPEEGIIDYKFYLYTAQKLGLTIVLSDFIMLA